MTTIAFIQHAGDVAYEAVITNGGTAYQAAVAYEREVTRLKAKLNNTDEMWLCPACAKVETPVDTLCPYCEGVEADAQDERQMQEQLRRGG